MNIYIIKFFFIKSINIFLCIKRNIDENIKTLLNLNEDYQKVFIAIVLIMSECKYFICTSGINNKFFGTIIIIFFNYIFDFYLKQHY